MLPFCPFCSIFLLSGAFMATQTNPPPLARRERYARMSTLSSSLLLFLTTEVPFLSFSSGGFFLFFFCVSSLYFCFFFCGELPAWLAFFLMYICVWARWRAHRRHICTPDIGGQSWRTGGEKGERDCAFKSKKRKEHDAPHPITWYRGTCIYLDNACHATPPYGVRSTVYTHAQ